MSGSTARTAFRSRVLRFSAIALLAITATAGCGYDRGFHISVDEERQDNGPLQGITVEGEGFTPNGRVLITLVMAATGGNVNPYIEETIMADANGEFRFEKMPVPCPQPADYQSGIFNLVVARDETEGISGSARLDGGNQPDCRGSAS